MTEINKGWKRDFDVYDRVTKMGLDLGERSGTISDPKGRRICSLTFTPSG